MTNVFRERLLANKVAFLTGGGSGIGLAIAECFAEHDAAVILAGRNAQRLETAKAQLESRRAKVYIEPLDVRNYQSLESAVERTRQNVGEIDLVIAAAAGNFPAPASAMSPNGFKAVIDIDVLGTFNTMRAVYPHLRRPGASLIAISAAHATVPFAYQSHVCAAKAGVELLLKTLAVEWGPEGIRCNCITPGATADTEGMRRLAPTTEIQDRARARIPLRRFGTKEELASLALFLCSDAAAYITGATFVCDGGQSLSRSESSFASAWRAAQPGQ
ncbi:MAG: SDR family oxidoreductase [Acidobacteriaceae bacterium]|nr:SDR family oxidoreductase [Acidobacteriaceae bacterium]MBV8571325.1 SDR family oxidoreductase [Acidobacteriaceae bacterium]